MNFDFFPQKFFYPLKLCDISDIYEIRLRTGYPVMLKGKGSCYYLSAIGRTDKITSAIICGSEDISETLLNVTERSLYAFNEQIKRGFITVSNGIRIGIAGECVTDNGRVVTIKNFTSLNIRIPHDIDGCASFLCNKIFNDKIKNTLIIAPPSKGKTTLLKDVAKWINKNFEHSILIIDERDEFQTVCGINIDHIRKSDKLYAFKYGIRSLSPNVIITDELADKSDWECAFSASNSGVKIIASVHASDKDDVIKKTFFVPHIFERYVVLKNFDSPGVIDKIYDKDFNII